MAIHLDHRGKVAVITLDRPERRNALDHDSLHDLLVAVEAAAEARSVVLTGAGGHFCAGADLSTVEDPGFTATLRRVLLALRDLPVPVIAAADGAALGGGTQLAVACDLRVATTDAVFGIPAAKLGLMVDHWTVQRLALDAGFSVARAMLVGAATYRGEDLHRLGFVHRLGGVDDAVDWAEELAGLAPLTIAGHKAGLARLEADTGTDPAYQQHWRRAWASVDLAEGMAAFGEKRRPRFDGR